MDGHFRSHLELVIFIAQMIPISIPCVVQEFAIHRVDQHHSFPFFVDETAKKVNSSM
jgi:hypothetical protein